jgi:hypothetical protein
LTRLTGAVRQPVKSPTNWTVNAVGDVNRNSCFFFFSDMATS